jgi:uncharacterized protein (DUF1778 family)
MYGKWPYNRFKNTLRRKIQMVAQNTDTALSKNRNRRTERLETRLSPEQKELIQRAASLQGRTLTDFVINSIQEAAIRTVREYEIMTLGVRDREAFVAAILDPSKPGDRLKAAYRRYRDQMGK